MILKDNITFGDALQFVKRSYEGNNNVSTVRVELYDGNQTVKLVYETPKGFERDQTQRRGKLEMIE